MNEKKYLIDNEPASANDIIAAAKDIDGSFGSDGIYTTSKAAAILRANGHRVGVAPMATSKE